MSYVKSLRRERAREGRRARNAAQFYDDEIDYTPEADTVIRITNRNRTSLDRKLKAAQTRDLDALVDAEWDY